MTVGWKLWGFIAWQPHLFPTPDEAEQLTLDSVVDEEDADD